MEILKTIIGICIFVAACQTNYAQNLYEQNEFGYITLIQINNEKLIPKKSSFHWDSCITFGVLTLSPTIGLCVRAHHTYYKLNYSLSYSTPFLPHIFSILKNSFHYILPFHKRLKHSWYIGFGFSTS